MKSQIKEILIAYFESNAKMTIPQAKAKILRKMKRDEYDNDIRVGNVKLFYTDNPNYANASGTGLGAGFYLAKTGFTGYVDVKV